MNPPHPDDPRRHQPVMHRRWKDLLNSFGFNPGIWLGLNAPTTNPAFAWWTQYERFVTDPILPGDERTIQELYDQYAHRIVCANCGHHWFHSVGGTAAFRLRCARYPACTATYREPRLREMIHDLIRADRNETSQLRRSPRTNRHPPPPQTPILTIDLTGRNVPSTLTIRRRPTARPPPAPPEIPVGLRPSRRRRLIRRRLRRYMRARSDSPLVINPRPLLDPPSPPPLNPTSLLNPFNEAAFPEDPPLEPAAPEDPIADIVASAAFVSGPNGAGYRYLLAPRNRFARGLFPSREDAASAILAQFGDNWADFVTLRRV